MENSIINELNAEAERIIGNKLLPAKSRKRYEQVYKLFTEWQSKKKWSSFSEEILIVYFNEKSEKAETFFSLVHLFNVAGNNKTEPEHWYRELRKIGEHTKIRDKICLWNILSSFRDSQGGSPPRLCPWTPQGLRPETPRLPSPVLPLPSRPPPHVSNN